METRNPMLNIFSKLATEIYLILLLVSFLSVANIFNVYRWHFGNVVYAIERDQVNLKESIPESADYYKYKRSLNDLQEKLNDTRIARIPILGMEVYVTDFTHFIIAICFLLLYWLYRRLIYIKTLLSDHLNEFNSNDTEDKTIYGLFYIVLPNYNKPSIYIENIYKFFLVLLFVLVGSNFIDIFWKQGGLRAALTDQDGWEKFLPHVVIIHAIALLIIVASFILYRKTRVELKHIRNTLILIKWNNYAFFPALYASFKAAGTPLEYKKNFIEYREYGNDSEMSLVITAKRIDRGNPVVLSGSISLVNELKEYIPKYKKIEADNSFNTYDEYIKRDLTAEEEMMKSFFVRILTIGLGNNNELAKDFKRTTGLKGEDILSLKQIKELIAEGRISKAFKDFKKAVMLSGNVDLENMITIIQREESELVNDNLSGIISDQESNLRKNRMVAKVLVMIEEFQKEMG